MSEEVMGWLVLMVGVALRAMAQTCHSLVTVDPSPWVAEAVAPTLPSFVVALQWRPAAGSFDMIFIDGDHQHPAVLDDIDYACGHLTPGGLIVLHDWRSLRKPVLKTGKVREVDAVQTEHGIGVVVPA